MKKVLALFIVVSSLCFIGLILFIRNSAPARLSTVAVNEAVMDSIHALEDSDHARALDILINRMTYEFEQTNQIAQSRNTVILLAVGLYQAVLFLCLCVCMRIIKSE